MPDKEPGRIGTGNVSTQDQSAVDAGPQLKTRDDWAGSRKPGRRRAAGWRCGRTAINAGLVTLLLVPLLLLGAPASVDADGAPPSACPELTDSIRRLFVALHLREPDLNEAFHWTGQYMTGEANLAAIANQLIRSAEFDDQHGPLASSEFVQLMYRNTRNAPPSEQVLQHWTRALNTGYTRGEMTLVLTESEDFVRKTATVRPLSGYLRWYPPGTHWYCGHGTVEGLSIKPLTGRQVFADRLIRNEGDEPDQVVIVTLEDGLANAVMAQATLPPRVTDYSWMGVFTGDGFYGGALTIGAAPSTRWMVVFYPQPIGHSRLGWEIDTGAPVTTVRP